MCAVCFSSLALRLGISSAMLSVCVCVCAVCFSSLAFRSGICFAMLSVCFCVRCLYGSLIKLYRDNNFPAIALVLTNDRFCNASCLCLCALSTWFADALFQVLVYLCVCVGQCCHDLPKHESSKSASIPGFSCSALQNSFQHRPLWRFAGTLQQVLPERCVMCFMFST